MLGESGNSRGEAEGSREYSGIRTSAWGFSEILEGSWETREFSRNTGALGETQGSKKS